MLVINNNRCECAAAVNTIIDVVVFGWCSKYQKSYTREHIAFLQGRLAKDISLSVKTEGSKTYSAVQCSVVQYSALQISIALCGVV